MGQTSYAGWSKSHSINKNSSVDSSKLRFSFKCAERHGKEKKNSRIPASVIEK